MLAVKNDLHKKTPFFIPCGATLGRALNDILLLYLLVVYSRGGGNCGKLESPYFARLFEKQAVKYLWKSERGFIPLFFEIIVKAKALQKTGEDPFQKQINILEKITACEKAGCGNGGKKKK